MNKKVYVLGTCDTKNAELFFIRNIILEAGIKAIIIDLSTKNRLNTKADISAKKVMSFHPISADKISQIDRGIAVKEMSIALQAYLSSRDDIAAVISLGGSGGTALATPAMQDLPIGLPKIMLSTMASSDVSAYVGASDIAMIYSVTDFTGIINPISAKILSNAAHSIIGMIERKKEFPIEEKLAVGLTMFGVTTPCINQIVEGIKEDYQPYVFHATGTGGKTLEKLIKQGFLKAVIDITTTEIADLIVGGLQSAGEKRLDAAIEMKIPYIASCGALDMVNYREKKTIPQEFYSRNLYIHNPQVTLMRTNAEENKLIGEWIAKKLNCCQGEVRFFIPEKGISSIDMPNKPFYDPEANEALFKALRKNIKQTNKRQLISLPYDINSLKFTTEIIKNFKQMIKNSKQL